MTARIDWNIAKMEYAGAGSYILQWGFFVGHSIRDFVPSTRGPCAVGLSINQINEISNATIDVWPSKHV